MPSSVSAETTNDAASTANAGVGPASATTAPAMPGPISVASCVPPVVMAFPASSSGSGSSAGTIANEPGRKSPSPAPMITLIGTRRYALGGPLTAATASAHTARARTASAPIITVHGRHRSLA